MQIMWYAINGNQKKKLYAKSNGEKKCAYLYIIFAKGSN